MDQESSKMVNSDLIDTLEKLLTFNPSPTTRKRTMKLLNKVEHEIPPELLFRVREHYFPDFPTKLNSEKFSIIPYEHIVVLFNISNLYIDSKYQFLKELSEEDRKSEKNEKEVEIVTNYLSCLMNLLEDFLRSDFIDSFSYSQKQSMDEYLKEMFDIATCYFEATNDHENFLFYNEKLLRVFEKTYQKVTEMKIVRKDLTNHLIELKKRRSRILLKCGRRKDCVSILFNIEKPLEYGTKRRFEHEQFLAGMFEECNETELMFYHHAISLQLLENEFNPTGGSTITFILFRLEKYLEHDLLKRSRRDLDRLKNIDVSVTTKYQKQKIISLENDLLKKMMERKKKEEEEDAMEEEEEEEEEEGKDYCYYEMCKMCSGPNCQNFESKPKLFKCCSRCKIKFYCRRECQINHWKFGHSNQCNVLLTKK